MTQRLGPHGAQRGALAEPGQAALLLRLVLALGRLLLVATLLVRGEEAAEGDDRAGCRQLDGRCRRTVGQGRPNRTDAVEPRASAIWDATVRFQISS